MNNALLTLLVAAFSFGLSAAPLKIISLSPHTTELVYEAGLLQNLIAVSAYSDYPEQAKKLEQVADYRGVNIERVLALQPDLVVAWKGGNPEKALKKLESFGIKIFYSNPNSLEDIATTIEKLGQYAENPSIAEKQAARLRQKTQEFKEKYQNKSKIRYFYQLSSTPLLTNNQKHWPQALFSLCGGENIFAKSPVPYPQVNLEQVVVRKPEAIFTSKNNIKGVDWYKWQQHIPAAQNNAIFAIETTHLGRPTSRALKSAEQICTLLDRVRKNKKNDF